MIQRRTILKSIAVCMFMLPAISVSFAAGADKKATVSEGQRALDSIAVQNLMSKHEFYHAAGENLKEVNDLWVSESGPNAKTACFFSPAWVMQGVASVKKMYGVGNDETRQAALTAISKVYPEIKDIKENLGIGGEFAMHTSTTSIIEVAGDGKTAKGIWYSPGFGLSTEVNGKSTSVSGRLFYEKYAGDFIKENGVWKIWHLGMYYDFVPQLSAEMTERLGNGVKAESQAGGPGGPGAGGPPPANKGVEKGERMTDEEIAQGGMFKNPNKYESYSPTRKPSITPQFPEPYYTFSETFSYAPVPVK